MDLRPANGSSGIDAARELNARQGLRCIFLSANLDERTMAVLRRLEPIDFEGAEERDETAADGCGEVQVGLVDAVMVAAPGWR
jgi:hypothetical protein